jgi:23S rRNA pseudouridine1911/1915/1917 synthase
VKYRHTVGPAEGGERLDVFLARLHPELSRSRVKTLIEGGHVRSSRGSAKPSRVLWAGEEVDLEVPAAAPARLEPESIPLDVLWEDESLIVVNKPAGMVVHPGAGRQSGTLVNALLHRVTDLTGVGGELRPGIVHRLDKDTSGCLVVAKSDAALAALQRDFKARNVQKIYLAIVHGVPPSEGTFRTLHGRHPTDRKRFSARVAKGRTAVTHFRRQEAFDGAALVEVRLETGRTHQIRVHFAEAGHPLLGDALYGGVRREAKLKPGPAKAAAAAIGRQALHASRLSFPHPKSGGKVTVEAPVPEEFARALAILRDVP